MGDAGSSGTRLYLMFNTPSPKVVTLAKYNGGLAEIGEGHPLGGHAERTASFFVEKIKEVSEFSGDFGGQFEREGGTVAGVIVI